MATDFTNNPGPKIAILTTGTDDVIATIGTPFLNGKLSSFAWFIKNLDADNALTGFKAQFRLADSLPWIDYLGQNSGDWTSQLNITQRSWSSADPETLATGAVAAGNVLTQFYPAWRIVASGTAGTQVQICLQGNFDTTIQ